MARNSSLIGRMLAVAIAAAAPGAAAAQETGAPVVNALHLYEDQDGEKLYRLVREADGDRHRILDCDATDNRMDDCILFESHLYVLNTATENFHMTFRYEPEGDIAAALALVLEGETHTFQGTLRRDEDGVVDEGSFTTEVSLLPADPAFGDGVLVLNSVEHDTIEDFPLETIYYVDRDSRALLRLDQVERYGTDEYRLVSTRMLSDFQARALETAAATGESERPLEQLLCVATITEELLPPQVAAAFPAVGIASPRPAADHRQALDAFREAHADAFTPAVLERLEAAEDECAP